MYYFKNKLLAVSLIVAILLLIMPSISFALGVGGMQLESTLNQKLAASIELLGVEEKEVSSIAVNLAPDAVYRRMGIEPDSLLKKLKFAVQKNEKGQYYIHVTTDRIVTEPFLNFLVELNWSNGRLLREFTILLDPPVLLEEEPGVIAAPQADLPPSFTVTKDSRKSELPSNLKSSEIAEVAPDKNEANKIVEQEPVLDNVKSAGNIESISSTGSESVSEAEPSESIAPSSLVYEQVQKNEILWNIAEQMRPSNITVEQMMLALQRENPKSFYGDNISFLKAGAVLRIADTSALTDISVEDAIDEISRQHQDWLAFRRERQAQNAVAAESSMAPKLDNLAETDLPAEPRIASAETAVEQPRLRLVSPLDESTGDAVTQTNAVLEAATEKLSQLNIEMALANEAVEAGKHENEELLNRLSALEEQMYAMQSLIQLKDAELQRLTGGESIDLSQIAPPLTLAASPDINTTAVADNMDMHSHQEVDNNLLKDPTTIATAIIGTLLLILLGWIVLGRKAKQIEEDEVVYSEETQKSLDELFPEDATLSVVDEPSVIKFNGIKTEKLESEIGIEPLTEITFENTEILDDNESLLDPIAEADVYLTYEKYDKAETLLHDAIESDPDRQELKLKLLEVFALARNIVEFDKQAEELYAAIGGQENNSLWQHALLMAEDISTHSPLFSNQKIELQSDLTSSSDKVVDLQAVQETEGKKWEVQNQEKEEKIIEKEPVVSWSPEQVTEFDASADHTPITDSELDIDEKKISEQVAVTNDDLEKAMNSFTDDALEEEWDAATDEQLNEIVNDAIINATSNSLKSAQSGKKSSDTSLFLLSDEVGTKLDLAKAYMEMGDYEGARDLLTEVLEEGTSKQVNEAKELMESS